MSGMSISVVIPTLNAEKVLDDCLASIREQEYPQNLIEILVVDGGSVDGTRGVAARYGAQVLENPLKTGESGKAVGISMAKGEIIALIDSDNILSSKDWFVRMVKPFQDKKIVLSEPWEYTYRMIDPWLTRYFALLGMNDPVCLFIGNFDRRSVLHNHWTHYRFPEIDHGDYLAITFDHVPIPTIGANGTLLRKAVLESLDIGSYYFDIDIPVRLLQQFHELGIAKVKIGIVHTFVEDSPRKFFRKQWRRICDYGFHSDSGARDTDWGGGEIKRGIYRFVISCVLVIPIFWQMLIGVWRSRDLVFLFHPVACYGTLLIYGWGVIRNRFVMKELDRSDWAQ